MIRKFNRPDSRERSNLPFSFLSPKALQGRMTRNGQGVSFHVLPITSNNCFNHYTLISPPWWEISHTDSLEHKLVFANLGKISGHDKIPGLESEPLLSSCYMDRHVWEGIEVRRVGEWDVVIHQLGAELYPAPLHRTKSNQRCLLRIFHFIHHRTPNGHSSWNRGTGATNKKDSCFRIFIPPSVLRKPGSTKGTPLSVCWVDSLNKTDN